MRWFGFVVYWGVGVLVAACAVAPAGNTPLRTGSFDQVTANALSHVSGDYSRLMLRTIEGNPPRRIALAIVNSYSVGNGGWQHLGAAPQDAANIAAAVANRYELIDGKVHQNVGAKEFQGLLEKVAQEILTQPDVTILLYFSGHGIVLDGRNYLVTEDAGPDRSTRNKGVIALGDILQRLTRSRNDALNVVIIDTCRDAPEKEALGNLVKEVVPARTFVSYATVDGSVVSQPAGGSVFTKAWRHAIESTTGLDTIENLNDRIAVQVEGDTYYRQRPVFQLGAGTSGQEVVPLGNSGSAPVILPHANRATAVGRALSLCMLPAAFGNKDKDSIKPCVEQMLADHADVANAFRAVDGDGDLLNASVAQAAEEGDATANLMIGLYDLTNAAEAGGPVFALAKGTIAPAFGGATSPEQRRSGWEAVLRSASLGNPLGALFGGQALLAGLYDPKSPFWPTPDAKRGVALLEQAERGGLGGAAEFLTVAYFSGIPVPKDIQKARFHARQMARLTYFGDRKNIHFLFPLTIGLGCQMGNDGPRDAQCADEILKWVATQGDGKLPNGTSVVGQAAVSLVQMYEPPASGDLILKVPPNDALSRHYIAIAHANGSALGDYYVGLYYETGWHGYPVNLPVAAYYYQLALSKHYEYAGVLLGQLKARGVAPATRVPPLPL